MLISCVSCVLLFSTTAVSTAVLIVVFSEWCVVFLEGCIARLFYTSIGNNLHFFYVHSVHRNMYIYIHNIVHMMNVFEAGHIGVEFVINKHELARSTAHLD